VNYIEVDELLCKARAIVNITMENIGQNRESNDDIEYALWAASGLLSQAIELLNEPTPKWPDMGADELAVQDEGGIIHFDKIFSEGPELRVTPDGAVVTTNQEF
jgi:hypothetical protein